MSLDSRRQTRILAWARAGLAGSQRQDAPVVASLSVSLLGPPLLGEASGLRHHKVTGVLAYLAVEGQAARESLSGLLWPEVPSDRALANLRHALHSLRKLHSTLIRSEGELLELRREEVVLDLDRLLQAQTLSQREEAARLWRGPFCEGLTLADCEQFEQWLAAQRLAWSERALQNLLALVQLQSEAGRPEEALRAARQALALDELSEPAHAAVIAQLMACGQRAAAVRQWQRCQRVLWEELGVEPASTTRALLEAGEPEPEPAQGGELPLPTRALVGREGDLEEVLASLDRERLVSLVGPGGIGKTRLALEAAHRRSRAQSVWWVDLADVREGRLLEVRLLEALRLRHQGQRLEELLRSRAGLVVLDNCEPCIEACAALVERLLEGCPGLRWLVTSREPLRLPAETLCRLESLPCPPEDSTDLEGFAAVRLFLERARAVDRDFALSPESAPAVAEICRRLDGIPLAIELACARLSSLSPAQIAARLTDRFRLLSTRLRGLPDRQQTLSSLVDWSYQLLSEEERSLFASLSVFAGSFSLEAVLGLGLANLDEWSLLDRLAQLVDKSLLLALPGDPVRYRMLETLREFAAGCLAPDSPWPAAHLAWFRALAEKLEPGLEGSEQAARFASLELELANFQAAAEWGLARPERVPQVLRMLVALGRFWRVRDHRGLARELLARGLESEAGEASLRARAWCLLGELALDQGDQEACARALERSLELARQAADPLEQAYALKALGNLDYERGQFGAAQERYRASAHLLAGKDENGVAQCKHNLGMVAYELARYPQARRSLQQALAVNRNRGDRLGVAIVLTNLGYLGLKEQRWAEAREAFDQSLQVLFEIGERWSATVDCLAGLAQACCESGELEQALELLAAAAQIRLKTPPIARASEALATVRERLLRKWGKRRFQALAEQAAQRGLEEIVERRLEGQPCSSPR